MKCRNCNNEVSEKDKNCSYCNTPLNNNDTDNGPTLGRGIVAFIIFGAIFLVAPGFYCYGQHRNDSEYTQTAIEPDSDLADNNKAKSDTIVKNTTANDSTQKQKEEQTEKVFNSIRRSHRSSRKSSSNNASSSSSDNQNNTSEPSSNKPQPIVPLVFKPRVEFIETD